MKKWNLKKILIVITVFLVAVVLGIAAMTIKNIFGRDKNNLFAYAIDLENEDWAYAPKGLDYGMTAEEVIKVEGIKNYTWEVENEILRIEKTVKNRFSEVKELDYVKRYFFDSDGELASVRYEMTFQSVAEKYILQLLHDQALVYMPKESRKTDLEELVDFERIYLLGGYNEVIVWEDAVYESAKEDSKVLTHAKSDVLLRIGRPNAKDREDMEPTEEKNLVVSLTISRYEDRLSQAQIEALREDYPICEVEMNPLVDLIPITMEICMWQAESFAYGINMGQEVVFDEKGRYEHNAHRLEVLDDTEKKLSGNKNIIGTYNRGMMEYEMPGEGEVKLVVPVTKNYYDEWSFSIFGIYYVTEDGYVIASYDEDDWYGRVAESALSGLKLEDFLRKVKK